MQTTFTDKGQVAPLYFYLHNLLVSHKFLEKCEETKRHKTDVHSALTSSNSGHFLEPKVNLQSGSCPLVRKRFFQFGVFPHFRRLRYHGLVKQSGCRMRRTLQFLGYREDSLKSLNLESRLRKPTTTSHVYVAW